MILHIAIGKRVLVSDAIFLKSNFFSFRFFLLIRNFILKEKKQFVFLLINLIIQIWQQADDTNALHMLFPK